MKKTLKVAILLIAILSMGHWMPVKQVRDLNSLSLQNVEALVQVLWTAQFNMIK